jgi:PST family polysaccharide transporter
VGAVFLLIKSPEDAPKVVIFQALSMTLSLSIQLGLMYREIGLSWCSCRRAMSALGQAWPFFLFVAIVQVYANANSFLLGIFVTSAAVSFYGGPERLMRGILSLIGPINQVLYPRLTYLVKHDYPAARRTVRSGALMVAGIGSALGLSLALAAPWFVALFGAALQPHLSRGGGA